MPIDYSSAVKQIEDGKTASEVLYTLQTFFSDYEFCLHNLSVLSPLTEKLRENPYSASALNDFAYALEHMDASVYDAFMRQPENKDVIELYKKTDRGTEEYRKALYGDLCAKGRSLISGFEKETGINLNSLSLESRKVYDDLKKIVNDCRSYVTEQKSRGDTRSDEDLIIYYENNVIKKYEKNFYLPVRKKSVDALKKLHQYLMEKSHVSDEQAEKWYNQNVEIDKGVFDLAAKDGWTNVKLKEYLKGLYRITNGLDFRKLHITTEHLGLGAAGYSGCNDNRPTIVLNDSIKFDISFFAHEFGHIADFCSHNNSPAINQFFKDRSNNKTGLLWPFSEEGYIDNFYTMYTGRVYNNGLTECISTGLEQTATVIDDLPLFFNYGYKYQAYDNEHLAITIGSFYTSKDIEGCTSCKEYVAENTAIAKEWLTAIKNSISGNADRQISNGSYSCPGFEIAEQSSGQSLDVCMRFAGSGGWRIFPTVKKRHIPYIAYVLWGSFYEEFPFKELQETKDIVKRLTGAISTNKIYVPFWYTIGMELPKMR